ncbi:hypothetical protein DERP_005728 [Dermatophagoides pteronyssinus]|uniref:Uncharacterized protein n=1 Tax=Dermatophagoides pteronyssinus TaxID=6956 RepID=A0ABQ8JA06_DERPT|nr:hypothetical protein DERP_005728 [Dermatophagoides pteronyssinus]
MDRSHNNTMLQSIMGYIVLSLLNPKKKNIKYFKFPINRVESIYYPASTQSQYTVNRINI